MDFNTEFNSNNAEDQEIQEKLLKLVKVLDKCIENIDSFYCYTLKKNNVSRF